MAFSNEKGRKILSREMNKELRRELKITRRKNTLWQKVPYFPCPNQCIAIRYICPRGTQKIFTTTKRVKTFLWFTKEVPIKMIYTEIPKKEGKQLYWEKKEAREFTGEIIYG